MDQLRSFFFFSSLSARGFYLGFWFQGFSHMDLSTRCLVILILYLVLVFLVDFLDSPSGSFVTGI